MDYTRWQQLNQALEHPGRTKDNELIDPWPRINFEGKTGAGKAGPECTKAEEVWGKLQTVHTAARAIARQAEEHAAAVMASRLHTEEGKAMQLEGYNRETVGPKLASLREQILSPAAAATYERLQQATDAAVAAPDSPYQIACDMASLQAIRERNASGKKKLSLPEISKMPLSTRRAVALSDPLASGISETAHKAIRNSYTDEVGGAALLAAEEQVAAVEAVATALDLAEVTADRAAGVKPLAPAAASAAKARAELEEGTTPN